VQRLSGGSVAGVISCDWWLVFHLGGVLWVGRVFSFLYASSQDMVYSDRG